MWVFDKIFSGYSVSRWLLTAVFAGALAACGGSGGGDDDDGDGPGPGGNGSNKDGIDLAAYMVPAASGALQYDEYMVTSGQIDLLETHTESWQVSSSSAVMERDGDEITISFNSEQVTTSSYGMSMALPRYVEANRTYETSLGDNFRVFGPFNERAYSVGGAGPSRTDQDVIILIYQDIYWREIEVIYYAKGQGFVGSDWYEECPENVPLSLDANFAQLCGGYYYSEIRSGGGNSNGDGGNGGGTGAPVSVNPSTLTTTIPVNSTACSGSTLGDSGDLVAINTPLQVENTTVSDLILRYDMDSFFGEPTRKAVVSWQGTGGLYSLQWLAEVHNPQGQQYTAGGQRVYASYLTGSIPSAGAGFGFDSTGSPDWAKTFVTLGTDNQVLDNVSATDAKNIYRACFNLANLRVLGFNGKHAQTLSH